MSNVSTVRNQQAVELVNLNSQSLMAQAAYANNQLSAQIGGRSISSGITATMPNGQQATLMYHTLTPLLIPTQDGRGMIIPNLFGTNERMYAYDNGRLVYKRDERLGDWYQEMHYYSEQ